MRLVDGGGCGGVGLRVLASAGQRSQLCWQQASQMVLKVEATSRFKGSFKSAPSLTNHKHMVELLLNLSLLQEGL